MTFFGEKRGVAAVAPANHGGATVGLGWPRDGRGNIFAGDEDDDRPWAGRPRGVAVGTPTPRTSLRDGRRREGRGIPPAMPSERGGERLSHQRDGRGRVVADETAGSRSGGGSRLRTRGRGKVVEDVASLDVPARTAVGGVVADKAAGSESPRDCRGGRTPEDVAAQDGRGGGRGYPTAAEVVSRGRCWEDGRSRGCRRRQATVRPQRMSTTWTWPHGRPWGCRCGIGPRWRGQAGAVTADEAMG